MVTASADTVLAGRYRLLREVRRHARTTLWRGVDETLARPVAVRTLDPASADPAAFLDAARAAGRLGHPRIASTYDAAVEDGLAYVVGEWVEGRSLADLLKDGPLPAPRATTVTAQVAEAVAYAQAQGVPHGDLDAGDVLVCPDGAVKVTDFRLGAVMAGTLEERDDTVALGALLYACLTARSVDGVDPGLAPAPRRPDGRVCSPRQVRAGIPRELDLVVTRVLLPDRAGKAGPITSPGQLVTALAPLPGEGGGSAVRTLPVDLERDRRPVSRWIRLGVPGLGVVATGGLALALGLAVGEVPPPAVPFPSIGPGTAAPDQPAAVPVKPVAARDFDPEGDGVENRTAVQLAYDADASTAWETSKYRNNASFGGLKPGVGLVFDLGSPVALSRVELAFPEEGVSVELRAADADGAAVEAFPVVASATDAKRTVRLTPRPGTTARYWVVWITRLVRADDGRFQAGVAEVVFVR